MANERRGAYSEVESLKKGKHKISKDYRRIELAFAGLFAFVTLIIFTEDFFSADAFYYSIIDYLHGKGATKKFNYERYIIIVGVFLYYFYNFLDGKHTRTILNLILHPLRNKFVNGFIRTIVGIFLFFFPKTKEKAKQYFLNSLNVNPILEKTTTASILNYVFGMFFKVKETTTLKDVIFTLLYDAPIRAMNSIFFVPDDLKENLAFEGDYLNKLKNNFFYQIIKTEDGLTRAKKLTIFKDKEYLFGKENARRIKALFRSPEMFDDLFVIIEGYLRKGLYDTILYTPDVDIYPDEYCKKYNLPNERNYKYFQTYLLRKNDLGEYKDNVTLSLNAIRIYMFDKRKQYIEFLDEIFSVKTGISSITNDFAFRILTLTRDVHFRKKVADFIASEIEAENIQDKKIKQEAIDKKIKEIEAVFDAGFAQFQTVSRLRTKSKNLKANMLPRGVRTKIIKKQMGQEDNSSFNIFNTILIDYIKSMLIADFSLVLFKMVIGQFMNLPAGIMVVKIEDYSTRMILEYYKQFCEIEIVNKRNDGQSKEFQSDNYVNLFLQSYAAFCSKEEETKLYSELYFKFNTMEYIKPYNQEELIKMIDMQGYNAIIRADKEQQEDNKNIFVRDSVNQDVIDRMEEKNNKELANEDEK